MFAAHDRIHDDDLPTKATSVTHPRRRNRPPDWFRDVVIYQLHVRSFGDSNGDGIGDFDGLTSRLDYLVDLGIDAIWLLPFFPSPLRDDGYDIADYEHDQPALRRHGVVQAVPRAPRTTATCG